MQHAPHLRRRLGLALAMSLLAGCVTVGPDYVEPELDVPARWNRTVPRAPATDDAALARWWTLFDDPVLSDLVARAAAGSTTVREAAARVREARARRAIAGADRFPTLSAGASAVQIRSGDRPGGAGDLYSLDFDASWELDVFGGRRRALEAAEASLEAAEEDLRDVLVTLVSEVALNYTEVRAFQTRLAIAEANLAAQTETYEIVRWRLEAGLTTELDLEQARFSLEQTRAQIPQLRSALEQAKNRLAVLIGENPGALASLLAEPRPVPLAPLEVSLGVPADTLRRRPDVRRAERLLAAQTARVGVAEAARYPSFSLLGSIGLEALALSNFFGNAARTTQLAASGRWTLFDFGRLRQNVEIENALQEQALIRYEAAVRTALNDVENALIAYAEEQERLAALQAAADAAQRAFDLASQQYAAGLIDFQALLESQRALLSLQDQQAVSRAEATSNLIRLYKALGGGWTPELPAAAPAAVESAS
ncbi:MAG TPA: efflux transporter outer membrane subunit [Burkholderiales bacterium]